MIAFQRVTCSLIVLCLLVFLYQQSVPLQQAEALILSFGMLPAVLFDQRELVPQLALIPAELTLLSSMFLHGGWLHLAGNMAFLWVFGDNVEDSMGHWRFLAFYFLCGLVAGLAHAFVDRASISPLIGASGAVSGVLGGYLVLHPRVKVIVLVMLRLPLRLPAWGIIGGWFGLQVYSVIAGVGGPTAWWAHVGGFAAGVALIPFFRRRSVPLFDRGVPH